MVPAKNLFKNPLKIETSAKFKTMPNFLDELKLTLCQPKRSCMLSHQFCDKLHVLSMHKLAFDFAKYSRQDELSFQDFLVSLRSSHSPLAISEAEEASRTQSKSVVWFELRFCRMSASIANACSNAGLAAETPAAKEDEHYALAKLFGAKEVKKQTRAMKRGLKLEDSVVKCLSQFLQTTIKPCGTFISHQYPVFSASPDGIGDDFAVEVKCPSKTSTVCNYILKDGKSPSKKVLVQMLLQLWITKKPRGYLAVAKPQFEKSKDAKDLILTEVYFADYKDFFDDLIRNSLAFYEKKVFPRLLESVSLTNK
jgi:YqaJ-like viral recombinase domain